jgi:hypothetical protein
MTTEKFIKRMVRVVEVLLSGNDRVVKAIQQLQAQQ